jgi:hypothetical protein
MNGPLVYQCSPAIVWAQDADRVLLIDRDTGQSWALRDAEAMLWDWLRGSYTHDKIVQMLSLAGSPSVEDAERTLDSVLENWREAGIIHLSEGHVLSGAKDRLSER